MCAMYCQIIDVDRILARSAFQADDPSQVENHPVIRTLYDHTSVSCVLYVGLSL